MDYFQVVEDTLVNDKAACGDFSEICWPNLLEIVLCVFQRKSLKCISHASNVLIEWSWWKKSVLCAPFFFFLQNYDPLSNVGICFICFFCQNELISMIKFMGSNFKEGPRQSIASTSIDGTLRARSVGLVWAPESFRFAEAYINYITNPAGFFPGNDDFVDNRTNPKRTKGETQTPLARADGRHNKEE